MDGSSEQNKRVREDHPGRRVTQRDIAAEMGISLTQVSFALRGSPRASKELQKRVCRKAAEMGYKPDDRMAAIAHYRKDSKVKPMPPALAWLNLWKEPEQLYAYREFELYRQGASKAAHRLGYRIEEIIARDLSPRNLAEKLEEEGIRGILVAPHSDPVIDLTPLSADHLVMVRFGLETEKPALHSVTASHVSNGELAFRKVRERGYERIGFVTELQQKLPFGAGFFWAQKECPQSLRVPLLMYSSKDEAVQMELLESWVVKERPDAIITDLPQIPGMLAKMGIRVPEDIALATTTIRDTPIDAGIEQHSEEIGRLALLTLVSLMNEQGGSRSTIQNQTLVEGEWVDGSMLPSRIPGEMNTAVRKPKVAEEPCREPIASPQGGQPSRRVTQRDIAQVVGVSHNTVSLALRNDPRVLKETRVRIQKKAAEMGYAPDPMLTAMGHYCRTTRRIPVRAEFAWLNLWQDPAKLYAYHEFEQYRKGALASARRHGYQLEEFIVKNMPLERLDKTLKTRNVRGILIPPAPPPTFSGLDRFPWQDYVVVRLGITSPLPFPHSVAIDDVGNSVLALERILSKGYKRVAFVGERAMQRSFGAGFYWAQRTLPAQQRLPMLFLPLKEPAKHRSKLAAWIRNHRPDAILTDNGELPGLLSDLGIRVPDDIGLSTTTLCDTPIDAGIDHNPAEIGRMGIVSLIAHLNDPSGSLSDIRSQIHVSGTWVDGSMLPSRV